MPDSPNVQSPKSKHPNGKRWKKDGETDVFEKKFAPKKYITYLSYIHEPRSYPNFGVNAHPTLPIAAHFFEAVWQIPPCVLPWAVLRQGYVTSRKVGRFNCHFFSKIQLFSWEVKGDSYFFKHVITVRLYYLIYIIFVYLCGIYEMILSVYHGKGVGMCRCKMENAGVIWAGETLFNFKVWQRTTENKYKRVANI